MKPQAVHFGAGALGRGLAIPFLMESGFDVIAVDADRALISQLQIEKRYQVQITDERSVQTIQLLDACLPDDKNLAAWLAQASVITTSVRKENLHHVAKLLHGLTPKTVICCENIEHSGDFFALQMKEAGIDPKGWYLPDCMVDRICSSHWPSSSDIEAESYGSICVAAMKGASIPAQFEQTPNIDYRFQEKRILVNTYADGISFLGSAAGLDYLYQAANSLEINHDISGYMQVMKSYLQSVCHFEKAHLDVMEKKHRERLGNSAIKRSLDTVARNFLAKITPQERFIFPLIELLNRGHDIQAAMIFLNKMINGWANLQNDPKVARQSALQAIEHQEIIAMLEKR
ncbi:mannitol dehydrogenase [Buttiauxella gaviniae]|uniref:mannitol dehydrogenase n=1 Tax=Buttiauxella gaviniae TaxID=82990 RepID=UPI0039AECBDA